MEFAIEFMRVCDLHFDFMKLLESGFRKVGVDLEKKASHRQSRAQHVDSMKRVYHMKPVLIRHKVTYLRHS